MFYCDKCGKCCRNLSRSEIYKELDRGDGVCKYLNGNVCSIYEKRPLLCRVDESYYFYYKEMYTLEEYYNMNYESCKKIKNMHKK